MNCPNCGKGMRTKGCLVLCVSCELVMKGRPRAGSPSSPDGANVYEGKRINLGRVGDPYVLGLMCEMVGLTSYAEWTMLKLADEDSDAYRLYETGRADAAAGKPVDVAEELYFARIRNPHLFDAMVKQEKGEEVLREVLEAIAVVEQSEGAGVRASRSLWQVLLQELPEDVGDLYKCAEC